MSSKPDFSKPQIIQNLKSLKKPYRNSTPIFFFNFNGGFIYIYIYIFIEICKTTLVSQLHTTLPNLRKKVIYQTLPDLHKFAN